MVVDTNIIIGIVVENNENGFDLVSNQNIYMPEFAKIEMWNVLRKYHFLRKIDIEIIEKYYEDFYDIITDFISNEELLESAKKISFQLNHPIYDCLFLALALYKDQPFMSSDKRLLAKANSLNIETIYY